MQEVSDTREFLKLQLPRFQKGQALHITIFYQERIAGVVGFNQIDSINQHWLHRLLVGRRV